MMELDAAVKKSRLRILELQGKQEEIRKQYQQARKKSVESRNRTAMRHKIKGAVRESRP